MTSREQAKERARRWRAKNPEASSAASNRWREKNQDKLAASYAKRYAADPEKSKNATRKWRADNTGRSNYISAKRRATIRNATPTWLTSAQEEEMRVLYEKARRENKQVDHIIPIAHKRVCGLHVPWNLQLLTKSENCKKKNKLLDIGCAFV